MYDVEDDEVEEEAVLDELEGEGTSSRLLARTNMSSLSRKLGRGG
jgi:hypothetical protein